MKIPVKLPIRAPMQVPLKGPVREAAAPAAEPQAKADEAIYASERRWGRSAIAAGFTILPNTLIEKMAALSLEPIDMCIILFLAKFWWTLEAPPFPAKETIAAALGCSKRTVQRRITYLVEQKLLKREKRRGPLGTNSYRLEPLAKALEPYAKEANAAREERDRKTLAGLKRKISRRAASTV